MCRACCLDAFTHMMQDSCCQQQHLHAVWPGHYNRMRQPACKHHRTLTLKVHAAACASHLMRNLLACIPITTNTSHAAISP